TSARPPRLRPASAEPIAATGHPRPRPSPGSRETVRGRSDRTAGSDTGRTLRGNPSRGYGSVPGPDRPAMPGPCDNSRTRGPRSRPRRVCRSWRPLAPDPQIYGEQAEDCPKDNPPGLTRGRVFLRDVLAAVRALLRFFVDGRLAVWAGNSFVVVVFLGNVFLLVVPVPVVVRAVLPFV